MFRAATVFTNRSGARFPDGNARRSLPLRDPGLSTPSHSRIAGSGYRNYSKTGGGFLGNLGSVLHAPTPKQAIGNPEQPGLPRFRA